MVPLELGAIVRGASLAQQERGAGVMQMRVVQDDEAGIAERVGPLIIVVRRIAELVDDQIIGALAVASRGSRARPRPGTDRWRNPAARRARRARRCRRQCRSVPGEMG